jgi:pimeloyl-ACP methyl ester carboxylesterase
MLGVFHTTALFCVAAVAVVCLSGCSLMMPKEIKTMEKESRAGAAQLEAERPDAFRSYLAGDRPIYYVEVTDHDPKPLILFIHGSPGDWTAWVRYLNDPELRQRAHMIAVDRPGFGGSGKGRVERSLARQGDDLAPLLDKTSPGQRVIVVGHSFGGPVAVRLAMDHGYKITDLIILAGSVDPGQEHTKWYQYVADWPAFDWLVPGDMVVANREIRALKPELTSMLPLWTKVTQRVSIIQGEKDNLVPPENADFAQSMLAHAASVNVIRIPGMNHFIPWTRYEVVKAEILKHLE